MDKIRQAIERSRAERQTAESAATVRPDASSAVPARRAAPPFHADEQALAAARILPASDPGAASGALRMLRTMVLQRLGEHQWRTLGVISARGGDGKTELAANLAVAIANDPRHSAVLVDLDVAFPSLAASFGTPDLPGLSAVLLGEAQLEDVVVTPVGLGRLEIVPLADKNASVDPSLVALPTLAEALLALHDRPDAIVVVNLPPVLDSDAALTAATLCDCLLFSVREGETRRAELERALGLLSAVPILGTVLLDSLTAPVAAGQKG